MSTGAALLQEVIEHPEDDAVRLVFADWLDENGGPAGARRAEFIRVQCELARLDEYDPARAPLEKKEGSLLRRGRKAWAKGLPAWVLRDGRYQFRRGFVWHIDTTAGRFLQSAGKLGRSTPLESVFLREVKPHLKALSASPCLARLRRLQLLGGDLGAPLARALARSPHLANLRELHLAFNHLRAAGVRILAGSPHLANLEVLGLEINGLGPSAVAALCDSAHLTRLRKLALDYNELGAAGARALAGWPGLGGLTLLGLNFTLSGDEGAAALARSEHLANLTVLALDACRIRTPGAVALANCPHLARLRVLSLRHNEIGEAGGRALAESPYLANLTSLRLDSTGTPHGIPRAVRALLRQRFGERVRL
jgi:uncharacterized protein (TIGR02996 family)